MANVIFSNIKDYSLMSCSFYIHDPIIEAIKRGLSSIGEYLDSRLIKASHSFSSQKAQYAIKSSEVMDSNSIGRYGAIDTTIWAPEKEIQQKLFKTEGPRYPMKLEYLDIPDVFNNSAIGFEFIEALD